MIIPAIQVILDSPALRLDGFIGPGHVSTVIGCRPYEFITRDFGKPVVIAGFEPLDILQAIYMLLKQLAEGRCAVDTPIHPRGTVERQRQGPAGHPRREGRKPTPWTTPSTRIRSRVLMASLAHAYTERQGKHRSGLVLRCQSSPKV
jgi:hypothetical protein